MNVSGFFYALFAGTLFLCYFYQVFYVPLAFVKRKPRKEGSRHELAVLICARNEERVLGDLLDSLKEQTYPQEKIHVFVLADNCSDRTASIAVEHGATCFRRHDEERIGKGYALDHLLRQIQRNDPDGFDGYVVLDADNVLKKDFLEKIDDCFSEGNDLITTCRCSKNPSANFLTFSYALWFLRSCRYLNRPRDALKLSCFISGTGFFFSRCIADELQGWPYHTLTEDMEFSVDMILRNHRIVYCEDAILYDEQPTLLKQSFTQRLRWSKGYLEVLRSYGWRLLRECHRFSCLECLLQLLPVVLSPLCALFALNEILLDLLKSDMPDLSSLLCSYLFLLLSGVLTLISEWPKLQGKPLSKIFPVFLFPLFIASYVPICFLALFRKVTWKPIIHTCSVKGSDLI